MRIAIDVSQVVYEGTGVSVYTKQLVEALLSIDTQSTYVLFGISWGRRGTLREYLEYWKSRFTNLETKIISLPTRFAESLWDRYHVLPIERMIGRVDVFHSSDWIQPPSHAHTVTTVHDLVVYQHPHLSHPRIVDIQKKRLKLVKEECEMVIADSKSTRDDLVRILNFSNNKIRVVYPGIDDSFFHVKDSDIEFVRRKYRLTGDYFLCIGTMEPRKNTSRVVEAFGRFLEHPLIRSKKKDVVLVFAGKGGWGAEPSFPDSVRVLGYVPSVELPALYKGACVFVYPSLFEGFGFPILESMAAGCPVVSSDLGSLKELVSDVALVVDPTSITDITLAMTKLYIDSAMRDQRRKKGLVHARKFTWEQCAKQVLDVYQSFGYQRIWSSR